MYKGRRFIRETCYVTGDYMDGDIYPVYQTPGKRRKRCKPTSEIQERLNRKNAEKKLTRLVHNNFTADDLALHLTYREEPADEEQAQRDLQNFIRRLKRRYKKAGIELKYISCTEFGKTSGRAHHHLIISGGYDRDEIEKAWGLGYSNTKRLQFEDDGVTGLAHYIAKEKHFYKHWNASRNLIQPEPIVSDGDISMADIAEVIDAIDSGTAYKLFENLYPDYILTNIEYEKNDVNQGIYIHYDMRRRKDYDRRPGKENSREVRGAAGG